MPKWLPYILLSGLLALVFITNYQPNTWLAGWDNLLPELNIQLNISRSIFAVWQEYQGLGLLGGMGHATDLIRQITLLPLLAIFPQNTIRYLWQFLSITIGVFGVYKLLNHNFKNQSTAITGAILYLLNFATIQNYYVAFEPFSNFYAFLPWCILYFLNKDKLKLSITNLFMIPSFYVPTMFVVYLMILGCIVISDPKQIKTNLISCFNILTINTFWLLPFLYFTLTASYHPRLAMGNQMANEETLSRNIVFGNYHDFFQLKTYYYGLADMGGPLMKIWQQHFSDNTIDFLLTFFGFLMFSGLTITIIKKNKNHFDRLLILLSLLTSTALILNNQPFLLLNQILRTSGFIDQVFRSPATKFLPLLSFLYAGLFSQTIHFLNTHFYHIFKTRFAFPFIAITLSLLVYMPIFFGGLFSPINKVRIPSAYFDLIQDFKTSIPKTARVANLPSGNFYGWTTYDFGLRGSGFLWYGIEQPILDRAFDVWNLKNESYYWELDYLLKRRDPILLENFLQKYNIQYILFDRNINYPNEQIYQKQAFKTKEFLDENLKLYKLYDNQLFLYATSTTTTPFTTNVNISNQNYFQFKDSFFEKSGDYITPPQNNSNINSFSNRQPDSVIQNVNNYRALVPDLDNQTSEPQQSYQISNNTENNILTLNFSQAELDKDSILQFEYQNISGPGLFISAFDSNKIYKYFFIKTDNSKSWKTVQITIPAIEYNSYQNGITILFDNQSHNQNTTTNNLKNIILFQSPITTNSPTLQPNLSRTYQNNYFKYQTFYYNINPTTQDTNKYLVLPQSYSTGWIALQKVDNNWKLLSHFQANNWANAFLLQNNSQVYIIFLPQLLQIIGFLLLIFYLFRTLRK